MENVSFAETLLARAADDASEFRRTLSAKLRPVQLVLMRMDFCALRSLPATLGAN